MEKRTTSRNISQLANKNERKASCTCCSINSIATQTWWILDIQIGPNNNKGHADIHISTRGRQITASVVEMKMKTLQSVLEQTYTKKKKKKEDRTIMAPWPISLVDPNSKWPPSLSTNLKYKSLDTIESISAIIYCFQ